MIIPMVIDPNGKKHYDDMWLDVYKHAGKIDGWYEVPSIPGRAAFIQKERVIALIDSYETGGYDYREGQIRSDPTLTKEKFDRMLKLESFE